MQHKKYLLEDAIQRMKARTPEEKIELAKMMLSLDSYASYREKLLADIERYREEAKQSDAA